MSAEREAKEAAERQPAGLNLPAAVYLPVTDSHGWGYTAEQMLVLREALEVAEAALADIGDADREPGDDLAWCEARAAAALPCVRDALKAAK